MEKYIEDITYSWHFNHMQHYGTTKIGCPVYLWHIITTYYICTYSFSADIFRDQTCPWAYPHVGASERSRITSWTVIPAELELTSTDGVLRLVNGKAEFWVEFEVSLLSSINQELLCIKGRLNVMTLDWD